jgi:hypothetical protein
MVNPKDYQRKTKHHKLKVNIRLRCIMPARRPTRKDVEEVLLQILEHNTVPVGWQVAFIEWGNPKGGSVEWKPKGGRGGDIGDIREFYAVIMHEYNQNRIGIVRKDNFGNQEDI